MPTRRLYYDDSFQREFSADVVSCEPDRTGQVPAWAVVLTQTAFYPASGGQPHDMGTLGGVRVLDVQDAEEEIVHLTEKPLELGRVDGCVNWERRFDHMQQHTGQHLLSAIFQERYGLPTISFHLGSDLSTIDLQGPEPSEEILEGAERAANAVVFEDRSVTVRYGTPEDLERIGIRKKVERPGILRAVEIAGIDLQPCGGTHVARTAQIGMILVRRCTKVRQDWRVEFVCGERAGRAARSDFRLLRAVAGKLTCAPEEVASEVERVLAERDAHFRIVRAFSERVAEAESKRLLKEVEVLPNGLRLIASLIDEGDADFLGQLATRIIKKEKTVALLASARTGFVVFAQHPTAAKDLNALLRETLQSLGGKGGGTRDFARGRLADAANAEAALKFARRRLLESK